jgi:hypothetical protein
MTTRITVLVNSTLLPTTMSLAYTAINRRVQLSKVTFTSQGGSPAVTVHIVPSGGSIANSNRITFNKVLGVAEAWTAPELVGQVLEAGDSLWWQTSIASAITGRVSGVEFT